MLRKEIHYVLTIRFKNRFKEYCRCANSSIYRKASSRQRIKFDLVHQLTRDNAVVMPTQEIFRAINQNKTGIGKIFWYFQIKAVTTLSELLRMGIKNCSLEQKNALVALIKKEMVLCKTGRFAKASNGQDAQWRAQWRCLNLQRVSSYTHYRMLFHAKLNRSRREFLSGHC